MPLEVLLFLLKITIDNKNYPKNPIVFVHTDLMKDIPNGYNGLFTQPCNGYMVHETIPDSSPKVRWRWTISSIW